MNSWLVTDKGIDVLPVSVSSKMDVSFDYARDFCVSGYLKVSPDGRTFAWGSSKPDRLVVGRFDTSTGKFSDIRVHDSFQYPYGIEFSPDSKILYVAGNVNLDVVRTEDVLTQSKPERKTLLLDNYGDEASLALQMSPDGRIYGARRDYPIPNDTKPVAHPYRGLFVIDNVSNFDKFRVFQTTNLYTHDAMLGLPTFYASYFTLSIDPIPVLCRGNSVNIYGNVPLEASSKVKKLVWDWGDGSKQDEQKYEEGIERYQFPHIFGGIGRYEVTLTLYDENNAIVGSVQRFTRDIVDCNLQVNRSVRINVDNSETQEFFKSK